MRVGRAAGAGVLLCASVVLGLGLPAGADGSGASISATVTLASAPLREVEVQADASTYDQCSGGTSGVQTLGFPDGHCTISSPVQIVNYGVPSEIFVSATDMVPSDGTGTPWHLCGIDDSAAGGNPPVDADDPACDGPAGTDLNGLTRSLPGPDQVAQMVLGAAPDGAYAELAVTSTPTCELGFTATDGQGGCELGQFQHTPQQLAIIGPSSSTDQSIEFSNVITWTAMP